MRNRFKRLYDDYDKIRKIPPDRPSFEEKRKIYLENIDTLMDVAGDVSTCLKEDLEFLDNMKTSCTMVIGSRDMITQR